jgi:uncharacterized membrane protein
MKSKRIESIDLLRGIIMVIMALDHTRDFFHIDAFKGDPLDLAFTTPGLYATRWVTHFCAPVFVFLSGLSAWLQSQRKSKKELSRFLMTRGIWLILMDLFVITLLTTSNIYYEVFIIQTLWAIGISMAMLGLLIWLPFPVILGIGLVIVLGHNVIDFAEAGRTDFPLWWNLLHKQGGVPLWDGHFLFVFYPFLPWTGLMIMGYCVGTIFTSKTEQERSKILLLMGVSLLVLFAVLRVSNIYGNPWPWKTQASGFYDFLAIMNVEKYPPSLLYMCATIGPALIFLALVREVRGRIANIFVVFGRVPMFFYVFHFFTLCMINLVLFFMRGYTFEQGMKGVEGMPWKFVVAGQGFDLFTVYLIWMGLVIFLYPFCRAYNKYKTAHPGKVWLSYL